MKAITFLGATTAFETTYVMPDGREHTAPFFGAALVRFVPDLEMSVFVTSDARNMHLARFEELVGDYVAELEPVDIPDGADESQLWGIFQAVVDTVGEGEAVIFDITHGFRSLPFLAFLASAYLRTVKKIRLEAVYYGNFEARDKSVTPNRAPVIDLTRFVDLLDWMMAADRFIRFGDAQDLGEQLDQARPHSQLVSSDKSLQEVSSAMRGASSALTNVSRALRLIRPIEAMQASEQLQRSLLDVTQRFSGYARPFLPLSRQVVDAYRPLAISADEMANAPWRALDHERLMVRWYLERKQYVQAVAVAREWVVSWALLCAEETDLLDRDKRYFAERALSATARQARQDGNGSEEPENQPAWVAQLLTDAQVGRAAAIYERLGQIRNDLLHAGKNKSARKSTRLEKDIQQIGDWLDQIALPTGNG